jgi:phosphatidylglycerol---prolipoprotein diacylglyceryl transferase
MPTNLPWGVSFPVGLPPTTAAELRAFGAEVPAAIPGDTLLAVHPTQLYETTVAVGIWLVGRRWLKRPSMPGSTALGVLALLAIERFGVEFLRAKDDRFLGPLTLAQAISLGILLAAGLIWARRRRTEG